MKCKNCGKPINDHDAFYDGKCSECRHLKPFEGTEFEITININSNECFSSQHSFITDHKGYLKVKALSEELDPPMDAGDVKE